MAGVNVASPLVAMVAAALLLVASAAPDSRVAMATASTVGARSPPEATWVQGACHGCRIAASLRDVQFVSPNEAWAVGYEPAGAAGAGDYVILHSHDSGRSWAELSWTRAHNVPTLLSFSSDREGWIAFPDFGAAEMKLLQTDSAGRRWLRLGLRDLSVSQVQYFGGGAGVAVGYDLDQRQGFLWRVERREWVKRPLPSGMDVDRIAFVDSFHGLVAGCANGRLMIARTVDGGRGWRTATVDPPYPDADETTCAYSFVDLGLRPGGAGLAVIDKTTFGLGEQISQMEALATRDDGVTWASIDQRSSTPGAGFTSLGWLGDDLVLTQTAPVIDYSRDAGQSWSRVKVRFGLSACRSFRGRLTCAGDVERGFWIARIVIEGGRP